MRNRSEKYHIIKILTTEKSEKHARLLTIRLSPSGNNFWKATSLRNQLTNFPHKYTPFLTLNIS